MKILFVSNTKKPYDPLSDPSTRYRCWYRIEDLRILGHQAYLTTLDRVSVRQLKAFDYVVFHRPAYCKKLEKCLDALEQYSIGYLADFDDLVFDLDYWNQSPAYICGRTSREAVIRSHTAYQRALRRFDHIILSTDDLANHARLICSDANIFTVRNGLGHSWSTNPFKADQVTFSRPSVSYFSGNLSHDHDFSIISDSLASFMRDHKDIELHIYGHLNFNQKIFNRSQISVHPYSHYSLLPQLIRNHTITISPLVQNQFNRCKSAVKFMEAATQGVPCVATDLEDYRRFNHACLTLALPDNWEQALERTFEIGLTDSQRSSLRNYATLNCQSTFETKKMVSIIQSQVDSELIRIPSVSESKLNSANYIEPLNVTDVANLRYSDESWTWKTRRRFRKFKRDPIGFAKDSRLNPINWCSGVASLLRRRHDNHN